jgi:hypothetical protein
MHPTNRLPNLRSRAFAAAGVATLGLSLLMAIAPAVAKSDNANSGTVKVHAVGQPADSGPDSANDPHVCQFWLGFYFTAAEGGTWEIYPWSAGADAAPALAGTYDTVEGFASTDALWLAPDHYKLFWLGANEQSWKHKAFWVDPPCPDPSIVNSGDDPGDVVPGDDPGDVVPGDDPGDVVPGDDTPRQGTQDSTSAGPTADSSSPPPLAGAPGSNTGGRSDTLPDTSTGSNAMFVTAAGLLMLVVAHRLRRRDGALVLG